ncbi:phosphate acyltransferase [Crateriforma conspicua]|uniref:Phosphate acetyltransferase n=1 Tax=Crateriforma conspicua TaxID=2527996 RepID=A0A5C5Y899_9PLAN|nr:phosphate acyltransferase [Crateriforma conspicua]TWT71043.1 Phosphate acetyltransferase [Crateriforma conspicua]
MGLPSFDTLLQQMDHERPEHRVVAVGADDATVLQALHTAKHRRWVRPVVVGDQPEIQRLSESLDINLADWDVIHSDNPAVDAVRAIVDGRGDFLMKGRVSTPDLLKAVLDRHAGLRTGETVCQIVLMEIPRDDRRFLLTDTGITIQPDPQQAESIFRQVVRVAHGLGAQQPVVATMAATEKSNAAMPETALATTLAGRLSNTAAADIVGPCSFDLAYSQESAKRKSVDDGTMGSADVMLFPNLLSANLTVKAIMYTSDCRFGGMLSGVACPVVFMSRSDDVPTRIRSLALASYAHRCADE